MHSKYYNASGFDVVDGITNEILLDDGKRSIPLLGIELKH